MLSRDRCPLAEVAQLGDREPLWQLVWSKDYWKHAVTVLLGDPRGGAITCKHDVVWRISEEDISDVNMHVNSFRGQSTDEVGRLHGWAQRMAC